MPVIPGMWDTTGRRTCLRLTLGRNRRSSLKNNYSKHGWGMAQVVASMSKHEALNSNSGTIQKNIKAGTLQSSF
jgi:hypothetical protein